MGGNIKQKYRLFHHWRRLNAKRIMEGDKTPTIVYKRFVYMAMMAYIVSTTREIQYTNPPSLPIKHVEKLYLTYTRYIHLGTHYNMAMTQFKICTIDQQKYRRTTDHFSLATV